MAQRQFLGIGMSPVNSAEVIDLVEGFVERGNAALINNVNVHACNLAWSDAAFRNVLNQSEVVFCDGFGVKLGAVLAGKKLGQRMTPPDWIDDLFVQCSEKGYSVFFVGDEQAVVELFVDAVKDKHPDLSIAGYHNGFFEVDGKENEILIRQIAEADADVILTGMGMPRQELWAWNAKKQKLSKGVFIATGALFRWYTGYEKRAPRWMTDHGMEWLARLVVQPRHHFKRYIVGIPLFFLRVILFHWFGVRQGRHV